MFLSYCDENIVVQFANNPVSIGKQQVKSDISTFWSMLHKMEHTFQNVYIDDNHLLLEANITYTLKQGKSVVVPCLSVITRSGDLVKSLKIFIDLNPLFQQ